MATLGLLLLLTGCGSNDAGEPSGSDIPPPPIGKLLPRGYKADEVLKANLTDGPVPETVVTSVGPPAGDIGLQPATIQVLSWDDSDKRWTVLFDAQKGNAPDTNGPRTSNGGPALYGSLDRDPTPILDREADIQLELVDFAPLLGTTRDQMVFSARLNYGGSGVPQVLAVVDFKDAKAKVLYLWRGEHLEPRIEGDRIYARSSYWTRADSHCCPSRQYGFVVGRRGKSVDVLEDSRPYLGVLVREQGEYFGEGPLEVLEIADGAPAEGRLRVGDVLLDVENAPKQESPGGDRQPLYNKVTAFDAGQTARLVIRRDGVERTIKVKLGSLKDGYGLVIPGDADRVDAL